MTDELHTLAEARARVESRSFMVPIKYGPDHHDPIPGGSVRVVPRSTVADLERALLDHIDTLEAQLETATSTIDLSRFPEPFRAGWEARDAMWARLSTWRGTCGHLWDHAVEDVTDCPRCVLEAQLARLRDPERLARVLATFSPIQRWDNPDSRREFAVALIDELAEADGVTTVTIASVTP